MRDGAARSTNSIGRSLVHEAGIALARHVMQRRGLDDATLARMLDAMRRLRRMWS